MAASPYVELDVDGIPIRVTNPDKVYFSARGETKLHLVEYFLSVAPGLVRALYERPCVLKRHPDGADAEAIYQKRVPDRRPGGLGNARGKLPSRRDPDELGGTHPAALP